MHFYLEFQDNVLYFRLFLFTFIIAASIQICKATNPECQYNSAAHLTPVCEQLAVKNQIKLLNKNQYLIFPHNFSQILRLA